jgi:tetratricopeptide (TPR) repeat protein
MRYTTAIILFFFLSGFANAQDKYIAAGDRLMEKLDFLGALEKYQIAYIYNEDYAATKKISIAYFAMQRFAEAAEWQKKLFDFAVYTQDDRLDYAESLIQLKKLDEAEKQISAFLEKQPDNETGIKFLYYLEFKREGLINPTKGRDKEAAYCIKMAATNNPEELGPDIRFEWEFDDGTLLPGVKVQHCFKNPGAHKVKLSSIDKTFGVVTRQDTTLSIYFLENVNFVLEGLRWVNASIKLDARDKAYRKNIYGVVWETGDGNIVTSEVFTHRYLKPGNYQIVLTVIAQDDNKNLYPGGSLSRTWNVIER